ncbi:MAG: hypothetical protein JEZ08_15155 [Clostridiales bacterium]|nr:hypothetical protein [Clostridiales bacterium]
MNDELKKYDIIDTFDENRYQTVLMGIDNSNYQDIVIINKLYKSEHINNKFMEQYKKITDNLLSVHEADKEFTVVNQYEQASLLSDFLTEVSLDLDERIRLAKSFLYQLSDFSSFELAMQKVFIQSDQLTIKNGILKFSNYIFLKEFQAEISQIELIREIGKTLELILQLHREKLTSELSSLQQFIYQLLNFDDIHDSYDDLYNRFKVVAATIGEDAILYCPSIDTPQNTDAIIEAYKQVRIPKGVIAPAADELESPSKDESTDEDESDKILQLLHELEEDITLVEDDVKIIEENIEEEETIHFDLDEMVEKNEEILIESLDDDIEDISIPSEEILDNAFEELSKFGNEDLDDLLNSTDFEVIENVQEEITETETIVPNLDELIKASIKDVLTASEDISNTKLDESSKLRDEDFDDLLNSTDFEVIENVQEETTETETIVPNLDDLIKASIKDVLTASEDISNNKLDESSKLRDEDFDDLLEASEFEIKDDPISETIDSEIVSKDLDELIPTPSKASSDNDDIIPSEPHFEDIIITDTMNEQVSVENQTTFHDEKHHSIHLNKATDDPIQEILDRNDKQYSDLYVTNNKSNKRFLPTFLLFFIVLIIITSLLIFYSSTYM